MFTKQKRTMSDPNSRAAAREAYVATLTPVELNWYAEAIEFVEDRFESLDECMEGWEFWMACHKRIDEMKKDLA